MQLANKLTSITESLVEVDKDIVRLQQLSANLSHADRLEATGLLCTEATCANGGGDFVLAGLTGGGGAFFSCVGSQFVQTLQRMLHFYTVCNVVCLQEFFDLAWRRIFFTSDCDPHCRFHFSPAPVPTGAEVSLIPASRPAEATQRPLSPHSGGQAAGRDVTPALRPCVLVPPLYKTVFCTYTLHVTRTTLLSSHVCNVE